MSDPVKMPCVKVTRPETHGSDFCVYRIEQFDASSELDGADVGEKICLEYCEMTQQEFEDLGEFEGW